MKKETSVKSEENGTSSPAAAKENLTGAAGAGKINYREAFVRIVVSKQIE